jgi:hypothetical protein
MLVHTTSSTYSSAPFVAEQLSDPDPERVGKFEAGRYAGG